MRRFVVVLCWLVFTPLTASALGLGSIELQSTLNQPFSAEIPLESYEEADLNSLRVGLASADTFERYGLDLPTWMQSFEFSVTTDTGTPIVNISSQRPVAEPFVTLLLDIKWSSGRLLREYTVLLDPPLFEAAPAQATVAPAETAPEQPAVPSESAGTVSRPGAPQPAPEPVVTATPAPDMAGTSYTVQRKDTLWSIAERVRGDGDMTVNQVMLALYRSNPEAFLGNINRLKTGAILRVPESPDLASTTPAEAIAAVREQNAALQVGAAASTPAEPTAPAEPAQLTLVAPVADAADPVVASADTASGLDAAARNAEAGRMQSRIDQLEGELSESQRLLEARDVELAAMQRRLAVLEAARGSEGEAAEALLDEVAVDDDVPLPEDALVTEEGVTDAPVDETVAEEIADTPFADEAADGPAEDAAAEEPLAEAEAAAEETLPAEEPSFLGGLFSNIWFWLSAAVLLVLALFVARRGREDDDEGLDDASGSGDRQAMDPGYAETLRNLEALPAQEESIVVEETSEVPVVEETATDETDTDDASQLESLLDEVGDDEDVQQATELQLPDDGDTETTLEKTISTGGLVDLDQADPIAEADFHMAYGLYDQAAELLERSLAGEPDNRDFRVKLIEVFFVWENRDGFLKHAGALRESIEDESDSEWNKVVILGRQLCPDDALFSGSDAAAPTADSMDFEFTDLGDDAGEAELDFTLGGAGAGIEAPDENLLAGDGEAAAGDLDFDLGGDDGSEEDLALDLGEDDLGDDTDDSATTMESPTVEADMLDAGDDTLESPTLESSADGGETSEMQALDPQSFDSGDIDLDLGGADDLDVDLSGLGDAAGSDTAALPMEDGETELADAGDIEAIGANHETLLSDAADLEAEIEAELKAQSEGSSYTVEQPQIDQADVELGETVEQPAISDPGDVDFDLGMEADAEDDVATAIQEAPLPEDATMTEVGTKLDLARAYIDMGDPDGARSILNEVLDEGGDEQQQEARQLLEELGD